MSLEQDQMSLVEHLTELRYRLVRSLMGIVVGMGAGLYFSEELMNVIRKPILPFLGEGNGLIFTAPMDKFMATIKVGALAGLILSCPYWLFHVWKFISPGLYKNERRYAAGFIVTGTILFLVGVCFVYFLVFPAAFEYLFAIGGTADKPMISINEYLSFFALMTVMFGVAFELPLVLVLLALMGVFDASFLKKNRRIAIVILAVVAAVMSPPDAMSMVLMWVPLLILYESSIWVIHFLVKKKDSSNVPAIYE